MLNESEFGIKSGIFRHDDQVIDGVKSKSDDVEISVFWQR